ncbi:MAG: hypothetical protein OSJ43_11545 [Oscillospiraceae bacterium]|nr:hypothetical protein [Oscillospiraceae bacterium]
MNNKIYKTCTRLNVNGYERTSYSSLTYGEIPKETETSYDNFKDWANEIFLIPCYKQRDKSGSVNTVYFSDDYGKERKITPRNFKNARVETQVIEYHFSDVSMLSLAERLSAAEFLQFLKDNGLTEYPK